MKPGYFVWRKIDLTEHRYLRPLLALCSSPKVDAWVDGANAERFDRTTCDGLFTGCAWLHGQKVGLVQCDFRVNGGSFGHANSRRLGAFMDEMTREGAPVFFLVNSLGVRIMEGRTVFSDAFSLWPTLSRFRKTNLLVTCAVGKCLGLGALLFAQGHYRLAVLGETHINLTGPEVMKLFFGEKFSFEEFASAERQSETTDLIHELLPDRDTALARAGQILALMNPVLGLSKVAAHVPQDSQSEQSAAQSTMMPGLPQHRAGLLARMNAVLDEISSHRIELFPLLSPVVKVFLAERDGKKIGIFINPPGNPNNMITIEALQKYAAGLDLFQMLRVPVISLLDSPGGDPRLDQSDRNNLRTMLWVGDKIIFYPHGTMGVVIGRCYGGATTLGFPKVFGARKSLILEGAQLGVMHSSIIRQLFRNSARLLEDWEQVYETETADAADLIRQGTIDACIPASQIGPEVSGFLEELETARIARPAARVSDRRMRVVLNAVAAERRMIAGRRAIPRWVA